MRARDAKAAIALLNVSKRYDGSAAVAAVTLEVSEKTCLALIGPSGCGKSTLLRLSIGLVTPDTGEVWIGGIRMSAATSRPLRLRTGYVIQEGGLFPHLTAGQNASLVANDLGWDRSRVAARLEELAELVRLPLDLLGRYPAQLSGGQRQRVGLMRALMLDPEILLMDEPLGALDPIIRRQLQEDLKDIVSRLDKTVLLVTHDMGEAGYLGDEVALMRDGLIVQRGTLRDLLERPAEPFVTEFIRSQRPLWPDAAPAAS